MIINCHLFYFLQQKYLHFVNKSGRIFLHLKGMVLMINTTNIKDDLEFVSKDNTNQKFDNEFKTINAEVLSQIAEKWLKAMEENNVEAILPKTKEELSFFEVWWYNLNLVKKFCSDNPNASLSEDQLIFG